MRPRHRTPDHVRFFSHLWLQLLEVNGAIVRIRRPMCDLLASMRGETVRARDIVESGCGNTKWRRAHGGPSRAPVLFEQKLQHLVSITDTMTGAI